MNFVAYGAETTHSLHMYHYIFLFVCIYTLARVIDEQFVNINCKESIRKGVVKGIYGLTATAITLFGVLYIRYDNYCYMQAEVRQEKAISYFTTLVTRIQSIEGYDDDYEVMFINSDQKENLVDVIEERYDPIVTNPYSYPIVNSYNWDNYLSLWIGYEPSFEYSEEYLSLDEVQEMPFYPDDESIQIIDDVIVVMF